MLPKSSECIATDQSNDPKRTLKIDELRKGCLNENEMTMILGKIIESDDLEYALRFFDSSKEKAKEKLEFSFVLKLLNETIKTKLFFLEF